MKKENKVSLTLDSLNSTRRFSPIKTKPALNTKGIFRRSKVRIVNCKEKRKHFKQIFSVLNIKLHTFVFKKGKSTPPKKKAKRA